LKHSFRIMFRSGLTVAEAIEHIREEVEVTPEVENLIQFMQGRSKRGVTR
jgi:acyl-[acyl carrier protein]--UDP-N-acetylglucosamine O-acyltransferase